VNVKIADNFIVVKGPKGELRQNIVSHTRVAIDAAGKNVTVERLDDSREARACHGLMRALISNMVRGVVTGYEKKMRIIGTGYRVEVQGRTLVVQAGYCKPVVFAIPDGIEIEVPKATSRDFMEFFVRGIDRYLVGETAARIRRIRPPDFYKGKGIRYADEHVRKLEGKSFAAASG